MRSTSSLAAVAIAGSLLLGPAPHASPPGDRAAGELTLDVDLTDPGQRIFRVREHIPVKAGALTLYYPKGIPGEHAPSGPIEAITGLSITTDSGTRIEWRRDLEDM